MGSPQVFDRCMKCFVVFKNVMADSISCKGNDPPVARQAQSISYLASISTGLKDAKINAVWNDTGPFETRAKGWTFLRAA